MVLLNVESPQPPLVKGAFSEWQVGIPLGGRAVNSPLSKGGRGGFGLRSVTEYMKPCALLLILSTQDRFGMCDHIVYIEAVLIHDGLAGSRSAETIHADHANVRPDIGLPSQ
jgi:hypothetical protein